MLALWLILVQAVSVVSCVVYQYQGIVPPVWLPGMGLPKAHSLLPPTTPFMAPNSDVYKAEELPVIACVLWKEV